MAGNASRFPTYPPTYPALVLGLTILKHQNHPSSLEFRSPSLPPYYSLCGKMRQGGRCAPEKGGRGLGGGGPLPLTPPGKTIHCYENRKSSQHCVTRGKHAGSLRSWPEGSNPDLVKPLDSAADFQEAQRTEGHSEWCFADEVSQVHPVGSSMRQMVFLPK